MIIRKYDSSHDADVDQSFIEDATLDFTNGTETVLHATVLERLRRLDPVLSSLSEFKKLYIIGTTDRSELEPTSYLGSDVLPHLHQLGRLNLDITRPDLPELIPEARTRVVTASYHLPRITKYRVKA